MLTNVATKHSNPRQQLEAEIFNAFTLHGPRVVSGDLLFSQRKRVVQAMLQAMSDEIMKIEMERIEFDKLYARENNAEITKQG